MWLYTRSEDYIVKPGYIFAKKSMVATVGDAPSTLAEVPNKIWEVIWNLKVPQKIKHFL